MAKPKVLPETVVLDTIIDALRNEGNPERRKALSEAAVELQAKEQEAIRREIAKSGQKEGNAD